MSETQHAERPEDVVIGEPVGAAAFHLVPSDEEVPHTVIDVVVDGPVGDQARPVAEVVRPAADETVSWCYEPSGRTEKSRLEI
jgi:hypothetical protein